MPLLKENELIGVIAIFRDRVQPFTDSQIDLVRAFAAEAIVALESTRRERRYREMHGRWRVPCPCHIADGCGRRDASLAARYFSLQFPPTELSARQLVAVAA